MQSIFLDGMRRGWAPWQPNMKFQTKSIGAQRIFSWANVIIQQICVVLVASSCVYSKIAPMKMVWNAVKLKKKHIHIECMHFILCSLFHFICEFFCCFYFLLVCNACYEARYSTIKENYKATHKKKQRQKLRRTITTTHNAATTKMFSEMKFVFNL